MRAWWFSLFMLACAPALKPIPREPPPPNEITRVGPVGYGGKRYTRLRVELSGAAHLSANELAKDLRVLQGTVEPDVLAYDRLIVLAWYFDHGYLEAKIDDVVSIAGDEVVVTFTVREGNKYRIRAFQIYEDVDGKHTAPLGYNGAVHNGDLFQRFVLVKVLDRVRRTYRDLGYAYVEADPQTTMHPEKNEVSIIVPINRGPLSYFETIDITGTKSDLRKEITVNVGEPYNETKLEQTKKNLEATGWFETVAIATLPGTSKERIRVSIEVKERASTSTGQIASLAR